jgi:hypothetical protein
MRVVVERAMYRFAVVCRRLLINRRGQTNRRIVARRATAELIRKKPVAPLRHWSPAQVSRLLAV